MAPLILEGDTLGKRHQHYNELVERAVTSHKTCKGRQSESTDCGANDIDRLLDIDVASNERNVEFILEVLKNEDLLYVSRVIKKCTWLITDQQYAHIINSEYLNSELFPKMTPKAITKFKKQIKLYLKDESRGEAFFENEKDPKDAIKWLPNCSVSFVEQQVEKHSDIIKLRLFKRLCEKSINILEVGVKKQNSTRSRLEATKFFLRTDIEKYLDLVEYQYSHVREYQYPRFGAKATHVIMKTYAERIINKFELYCKHLHLPTFVTFLKQDNVKEFMYKQVKKERTHHMFYFWNSFKNLKLFIDLLPSEERFQFVNQVFINKVHTEADTDENSEKFAMRKLCFIVIPRIPQFKFYEFAEFDTAFTEITKLIRDETSSGKKSTMLEVLLNCAGQNMQNIHTLLQYFHNKHENDQFSFKRDFVETLLSQTNLHRFDEKSWEILDEVFKRMDVYIESDNQSPKCVEAIIIHKILLNDEIPEAIEKKFKFSTLKSYQKTMNQEDKDKIFNYLYSRTVTKFEKQNVKTETEFTECVETIGMVLDLLMDCKKELSDYPWILNKIKECIRIKKENSWKADLSVLYNKKKSWRKVMFEDSLVLSPSEEVCLNALKHGPGLLSRHNSEVEALCRNDAVSLRRLLGKLRVYWPQSLAGEWSTSYLGRLEQLDGHKALIRGLCFLLPLQQFLNVIHKNAPDSPKIDFNTTSELKLSLQRHIAKNMHFARPQPPPDAILLYAKGDFLQYALPSLLAIFYNLNASKIHEHLLKLLSAPVSLQKHGIRFAFTKLQHDELKQTLYNTWNATKNASIRAVIFNLTFSHLCKTTNEDQAKDIWELLEMFIDNLTYEEDAKIYALLSRQNINNVPIVVRAQCLMKGYKFIKCLLTNLKDKEIEKYRRHLLELAEYTRTLMENLPSQFVADIVSEFVAVKFLKTSLNDYDEMMQVISAYILCAKNEQDQTERYKEVMLPLIKSSFASWDELKGKEYFIRKNFAILLRLLRSDLQNYVVDKKIMIPVKMYSDIQAELAQLSVPENYIMLTMWRLTVEFTKIIDDIKTNYDWSEICKKAAPTFGDLCLQILKEDVKLYFPGIYSPFASALAKFSEGIPETSIWEIYNCLLADEDFVQGYLATIKIFPLHIYGDNEEIKLKSKELHKALSEHSSVEIKMHYYHKFKPNELSFL